MNNNNSNNFLLKMISNCVTKHPKKCLAFSFVLFLIFSSGLPNLKMDATIESFLAEKDPTLESYNQFKDVFGKDELILLAVETQNPFSLSFLEKFKNLHDELQKLSPHIDEVKSLVNARLVRGEKDELIIEELKNKFPQNEKEIEEFKNLILNNKFYKDYFVSKDQKSFSLAIKLVHQVSEDSEDNLFDYENIKTRTLTETENNDLIVAIKSVLEKYKTEEFTIYATGSPLITYELHTAIQRDVGIFIMLSLVFIGLFLFLVYRRFSAVCLPFVVIFGSLFSTLGFMGSLDIPLKLVTQVLPTFLIAVGVADAIHLMSKFYDAYDSGLSKGESIRFAISKTGKAIFLTSLTTAAGLFSFAFSELAPIKDLGYFAGVGVFFALFYSLFVVPSLLIIFPIKARKKATEPFKQKVESLLLKMANLSITKPKQVLFFWGLFAVLICSGMYFLKFSHNPLHWLEKDSSIRESTEFIDAHFSGSNSAEIVFVSKNEKEMLSPKFLRKMDLLQEELLQSSEGVLIGKSMSIVDIVKESHYSLHNSDEMFYQIPKDVNLIKQEVFLFESSGSDFMRAFATEDYTELRMSLKMPWKDANEVTKDIELIDEKVKSIFGNETEYVITGMIAILSRTIDALMTSMEKSYYFAAIVISLLMFWVAKKWSIGLLCLLPNLLPIALVLGFMGWVGIPLDMSTMLIGSLAFGLVVDDTIHFISTFSRFREEYQTINEAIIKSILFIGPSLFFTTIVLAGGFSVFMISSLQNMMYFGVLIALTVIVALFADLLLLPALMKIVLNEKKESQNEV